MGTHVGENGLSTYSRLNLRGAERTPGTKGLAGVLVENTLLALPTSGLLPALSKALRSIITVTVTV